MYENTQPIEREALLKKANALIAEHQDYFSGLHATGVEQNGDILVFRGDYFLDQQGLPTRKSTTVFNVFKYLAQQLSSQYHLKS
ncbi:DUF2498 family protein [Winslowiella iniecta]|uniref:Protein yciN n=1 Tax=Winslowiella iniecta TaxID=1560201 RepID=A0A0L7SYB1_9GAMM|nr:DUF2498 family protein [Winslowiella iniecta]KOC87946.1 hypothetical protein NG43_20995 [Winslowiella iniecta]KOC90339.1 hypothetical protein NG42_09755 [Winslowiella iniecta]